MATNDLDYDISCNYEFYSHPPDLTTFKKIKAGYRDFYFTLLDNVFLNGKEVWGKCSFDSSSIEIKQNLDTRVRAEVVLHELTHIAYDMAGLHRREGLEEEPIVEGISQHLATLMRDNPELFKRIIEDLK